MIEILLQAERALSLGLLDRAETLVAFERHATREAVDLGAERPKAVLRMIACRDAFADRRRATESHHPEHGGRGAGRRLAGAVSDGACLAAH